MLQNVFGFLDITGGKPVKIVLKIWQIRDLWWQVYLWAQNTQNHIPIMQSEVYLLESLLHVLAHRISLSAPEGLLCMELLSFDVLSDIVFSKTTLLLHGYAVYLSCTANWMHGSICVVESKSRWRNGIRHAGKTIAGEKISALCAPQRTWTINFCSK